MDSRDDAWRFPRAQRVLEGVCQERGRCGEDATCQGCWSGGGQGGKLHRSGGVLRGKEMR